jgi:phenol 2-monooxygenase
MRAVFQQNHRHLALEKMPRPLLPANGRYSLTDYEKIFCPDLTSGQDIFDMRGINRQSGAIIVVRPDQFVASIMPSQARESLTAFFDGFMVLEDGL